MPAMTFVIKSQLSSLSSLAARRAAAAAAGCRRSAAKSTTTVTTRTMAAAAASTDLVKTSLYELHKELGGKMVPFAGYELPVQYEGENGGVKKEHLWCRQEGKAALFDVSHMGQIRWHGKDRVAFLEKLVVGDIAGLAPNHGLLSLVTNDKGGIIDDTVITNAGDYVYMVVNGATKFGDMQHFEAQLAAFQGDVRMEYLGDDVQLLAVQGPGAADVVKSLVPASLDLSRMPFMTGIDTTLDGVDGCRITRCGYTGEDGFEIAMPASAAVSIAGKLLENPNVNPTGLGARDSLRLEAGLCLYGNDLDHTTTPIEGSLGWTMGGPGSRRRVEQGFLGAEHILTPDGKFKKVARKRVGIAGMRAPAREHTEIFDAAGERKIGEVTSGTFGPTVNAPVAMGYVETASSKVGTDVMLSIRGKMQKAQVAKMPFITPRYYKVPE